MQVIYHYNYKHNNGENVPQLEITEVVLVDCNLVIATNKIRVLYILYITYIYIYIYIYISYI